MLRSLWMNGLTGAYARLKDLVQTYGKWVEKNEAYLDGCW